MWPGNLLLFGVVLGLAGCKPQDAPVENRLVRAVVVDLKAVGQDRYAIGEVKPRYESDLSFRVGGKVLSRLVNVGVRVKQGDTLATLDPQDYENRLRSAEADVASAEAAHVEAQSAEGRQAKLLKDGWTPRAPTTPRCEIFGPPRPGSRPPQPILVYHGINSDTPSSRQISMV